MTHRIESNPNIAFNTSSLVTIQNIYQRLIPNYFDALLFRAVTLMPPDLRGLTVKTIGSKQHPSPEQMAFLRESIPPLKLWRFMRFQRRGQGRIFFAYLNNQLCHYTFVTPGRAYRRLFPIMEPESLMIGPCLTKDEFRGSNIYPRMLRHVVNQLGASARIPFYIYTYPENPSSIRGIEKGGFARCGLWACKRYFLGLKIESKQTAE